MFQYSMFQISAITFDRYRYLFLHVDIVHADQYLEK